MLFKIFILALVIQMSKCSMVLDSLSQRSIHVSDYCPKMKYCPEGAHVMCMYYDPKHLMGPRCSNPKNVSITHELANKLLEVSNAVRSKIALGKEKGKGGNYLPKGYGIFRLKWDSELATFAQVLANQCVLRHDLCRATKKFPDPGQTAGLVRFSHPDWYPVSKLAHFTTPGLNSPKLFYAITQTLKSWYGQKNAVTPDMITSYPDWLVDPNHQDGRLYLEMIYGPATHMGCGISAYTEYAYYDNNAALNYNSVQIICNYSSRPRKFGTVYNTIPPTTSGFTTKCGCPAGSDEDTDCLCQESTKIPDSTPQKHVTRKCAKGDVNCDPTVVVLPIFTMEDAPRDKLITSYGGANSSIIDKNSLEIFDYYEKAELQHNLEKEHINNALSNTHVNVVNDPPTTRPAVAKRRILDVRNRYFNTRAVSDPTHNLIKSKAVLNHTPLQRRQSVFTRVPKFELPCMKPKQSVNARKFNGIKKDVTPRKNFDSAQNLVKRYMTRKITNDPFNKIGMPEPIQSLLSDDDIHENNGVTETILHTAEDKVIDYNKYLNNPNIPAAETYTQGLNKSTDMLMMLLYNLEKLVRNVELHDTDKYIFDAKIKKIYEEVIDKPINLQSTDNKIDSGFHKTLSDSETNKRNDYDTRTDVVDKFSHNDFNKRPLTRNQNSLIKDEEIKQKELKDNIRDYSRAKFIISAESSHYPTYADEIKPRNVYKSDVERNVYRNEKDKKLKHHNDKEKMSKNYVDFDAYDDPLSPDRRKYYQEKLERMERKLRNTRKHRNDLERQRGVRPMRPTEDLRTPTRSKNQMEDTFYPERARYLNRF